MSIRPRVGMRRCAPSAPPARNCASRSVPVRSEALFRDYESVALDDLDRFRLSEEGNKLLREFLLPRGLQHDDRLFDRGIIVAGYFKILPFVLQRRRESQRECDESDFGI